MEAHSKLDGLIRVLVYFPCILPVIICIITVLVVAFRTRKLSLFIESLLYLLVWGLPFTPIWEKEKLSDSTILTLLSITVSISLIGLVQARKKTVENRYTD